MMEKILNKLLEMMGVGREVVADWDEDEGVAIVNLPLGLIPAGSYSNGLWGDVTLLDTDATLTFTCGDLWGEGEFLFGEGCVNLNYAPDNEGLAYTNELEDLITQRIEDLYGLDTDGSEQGMQGDEYLSLDIHTELEEIQAA